MPLCLTCGHDREEHHGASAACWEYDFGKHAVCSCDGFVGPEANPRCQYHRCGHGAGEHGRDGCRHAGIMQSCECPLTRGQVLQEAEDFAKTEAAIEARSTVLERAQAKQALAELACGICSHPQDRHFRDGCTVVIKKGKVCQCTSGPAAAPAGQADVDREVADLNARVKRLDAALGPLHAQNEALREANEALRKEADVVLKERDAARAECSSLRAENERLKKLAAGPLAAKEPPKEEDAASMKRFKSLEIDR